MVGVKPSGKLWSEKEHAYSEVSKRNAFPKCLDNVNGENWEATDVEAECWAKTSYCKLKKIFTFLLNTFNNLHFLGKVGCAESHVSLQWIWRLVATFVIGCPPGCVNCPASLLPDRINVALWSDVPGRKRDASQTTGCDWIRARLCTHCARSDPIEPHLSYFSVRTIIWQCCLQQQPSKSYTGKNWSIKTALNHY